MNYYVRKSDESKIEGPFTLEQVKQRLAEGRLVDDSLATADLGEGLERISKSPKRDWYRLTHILGANGDSKPCDYREIVRPSQERLFRAIVFASLHLAVSIGLGALVFAMAWGAGLSDTYNGEPPIGFFSLPLIVLHAPVALIQWVLIKTSTTQTGLGLNGLITLGALWSLLAGVMFSQLTRKTKIR